MEIAMRRPLLLLAVLLATPLQAQVQFQPSVPQVVATGRGDIAVAADAAMVIIAVESRQASAAAASADIAQRMRAVREALIRVGVPADSITTSAYSVQPNLEHTEGRPRQNGYLALNAVRVRTRRLDQVGPIIDAAIAAGANRVDGVQFGASSTARARRAALAEAVAEARGDAEEMARAAGGRLGELLELSTVASPGNVMIRGASSIQTALNPADIQVQAVVTGRWRFVP
jgi:uncharacterized protein YggE